MKYVLSIALICGFFAIGASAQSVSGSLGTVKRGVAAKGKVVLSIPGGLHVNSSRPNSENAIATAVSVSASGAKIGSVTYPRGTSKTFAFSNTPINIYEGTVVFPFSITVPKTFKGNSVTVRATVKYQACTDEACYRPTSKTVTFTAAVK